MRTFLAVEIPEQVRRKVDRFINEEKKNRLPIKWIKIDNLHITLKFLGEIDEKKQQEILSVLEDISESKPSFQMDLEGVGCFPHLKNPRVLWIAVQQGNEVLTDIANELEEGLSPFGFKTEKRFHGHLTIGRVKKFCKVDDILARSFKSEVFSACAITLFKSTLTPQGPIYETLEKFNLG